MTRVVARLMLVATGLLLSAACSRRPSTAATPPAPAAPSISDGRSLVRAMRQRYGGAWYRTLSLTQNNVLYNARGGESKSQWRQSISVPGKLRIDYLPLSQRSGVLFDGSRVHTFDNGRAIDTRPGINPLLLLVADVYALPPERSAQLLDSLGFDLTTLRRESWDGQGVYVVGAAAGDTTTSQFWIDTTRLVTIRMIQKERRGTRDLVTDVRLGTFAEVGGFPIATETLQYRDGRLVFRQQYVDLRVNEPLDDAVFDATSWASRTP